MRAAGLIALKDLRLRVRDKSAFLVGLVVPLALAFVFNLVFAGAFGSASLTTIGYVDADGGELAVTLGTVLDQIESDGLLVTETLADEAALRSAVDEGDVSAGILVPAGFTANIQSGGRAELVVVGAVDRPTTLAITQGIATAFTTGLEDVQRVVGTLLAGGTIEPAGVPELIDRVSPVAPAVTLGTIDTADRVLDTATYFAAGLAVFFLFFLVGYGVIGLIDERREGTLTRLTAAPIPRWSVIVGKAVTSLVLGVVALSVVATATTLLMGADWGNPVGVGILIVMVTLAATAIGGLVAAFARTAEGAGNLQSIIAVILGMLGGSFFPVAGGNPVIEAVSRITPHSWFLNGISALRAGEGLSVIVPSILGLAAFAVVIGTAAAFFLKRKFA